MKPVKTGIIGCGYISGIYLKNSKLFESFEVTACADLIPERAKKRARGIQHLQGVQRWGAPERSINRVSG